MTTALIDAVEREGLALAAAARQIPLDRAVPTCPDWSVAELVAHAGLFTAQVAGESWAGGDPYAFHLPQVPDPPQRVDWYEGLVRESAARLRKSLTGDTSGLAEHLIESPVHFAGMLAREIPVHRWDVENAAGDAKPVPPIVAVAGVDAMCERFLPAVWSGVRATLKTVELVATDADLHWTVTFLEGGPLFQRGPRPSVLLDASVKGSASDLLLLMFSRPGRNATISGDALALPRPWQMR
jgi:uncharacterized protein (TIGR03083 family)